MKDKVTVVIPAYNKADYTVQALQSVYNQTYKDIEVIIIDDFGTDNLWEKIEPYARGENFKFIRLGKNECASAAIIKLSSIITGIETFAFSKVFHCFSVHLAAFIMSPMIS